MKKQIEMMEEFHQAFGHPIKRDEGLTHDNVKLRTKPRYFSEPLERGS
jgi:hypothetical protein